MKITKRQLAAYVEAHGFNASPVSVWPRLNKAAEGGIQHLVSVDNGAYYAELWGRGGSYYAVTGAGVYQMPGLAKGAKLEEALDVFLEKVVGKRQDGVPLSALRKMAVDVASEVEKLEKHVTPGKPHTDRSGHWHQDVQGQSVRVPGKKSEAHIFQNPVKNQVPTPPSKRRRPAPVRSSLPDEWKAPPRPTPAGGRTGTSSKPYSGPGNAAAAQTRGVEKHEAPQEHGPHPHGGPPTAPPNWKPKKLIGGTSSHQRAAERHFAGQTPAPITKDVGIPKPKASTPPVSPPTTPASPPKSPSREPHTEFSPQSTPRGPRGMGSRGGYSPKKTHAQYRGSPTTRDRRELEKENMPSSIPVSTEPVAKAKGRSVVGYTHKPMPGPRPSSGSGPSMPTKKAEPATPKAPKTAKLTTDEKLQSQRAARGTRIPRQFSHIRRADSMAGGDTPHGGQVHGHLGDGGVTHSHTYGTHATATPLSMKPKPEDRTPGRYGSGYSEHERRFGHAAGDLRRAAPAISKPMSHWHGEHQHTHPNEGPHSHGSDAVVVTPPVRKDVELNDMQYLAKRQETRVDLINKTAPIIEKDRTYLKPGEDAPEGSDTETGPRGGKYYETYEHGKAGPTKGGKWSRGSVEDWLWDQDIHADHISKHPDGTFSMKRAFYYKFGQSAGKFAEKIKAAGGEIISAEDQERQWPKTSYFVVRFKPPTGK